MVALLARRSDTLRSESADERFGKASAMIRADAKLTEAQLGKNYIHPPKILPTQEEQIASERSWQRDIVKLVLAQSFRLIDKPFGAFWMNFAASLAASTAWNLGIDPQNTLGIGSMVASGAGALTTLRIFDDSKFIEAYQAASLETDQNLLECKFNRKTTALKYYALTGNILGTCIGHTISVLVQMAYQNPVAVTANAPLHPPSS